MLLEKIHAKLSIKNSKTRKIEERMPSPLYDDIKQLRVLSVINRPLV